MKRVSHWEDHMSKLCETKEAAIKATCEVASN